MDVYIIRMLLALTRQLNLIHLLLGGFNHLEKY